MSKLLIGTDFICIAPMIAKVHHVTLVTYINFFDCKSSNKIKLHLNRLDVDEFFYLELKTYLGIF